MPRVRWRMMSGFTLVEMIVVLFVISVVLMMALPNLRQAGVKAQVTTCEANQRLIHTQLENYFLDHQYRYPLQEQSSPSAEEILKQLQAEHYLQTVPACPADGTYAIVYDGIAETTDPTKGHVRVACTVHGELGVDGTAGNEED